MQKIWEAIILFIRTITGIEARDSLNDLSRILMENQKQRMKESEAQHQLQLKTFQMIYRIRMKAFFPIIINSRGKAINLSLQRDMKADFVFDPARNDLNVELIVDRDKFESLKIELMESYKEHPARPLILFAKDKFEARDRIFMDGCQYNFILNIYAFAFEKEFLTQRDIMEILGKSIIEIAKPEYIKVNELQDFDLEKGPIAKEKTESKTFPANENDEIKTEG